MYKFDFIQKYMSFTLANVLWTDSNTSGQTSYKSDGL